MSSIHLGFLGSGNMAEAIARGILRAKVLAAGEMIASDPDDQRRALWQRDLGIPTTDSNEAVVAAAPVILVAVKPQAFDKALVPLGSRFGPDKLVLSICAGISTGHIEDVLAAGTRVVRSMPNTPMLVGRGMAAIAPGRRATPDDLATAERLLGAAAEVLRVPENLMDAVTAVSGSGPAYFFYLTELLAQAAVELGLSEDDARRLARVTFAGAAEMVASTGEDPAVLRKKVTSPGGTTEAAIRHLESHAFGRVFIDGVRAARDRGKELGR